MTTRTGAALKRKPRDTREAQEERAASKKDRPAPRSRKVDAEIPMPVQSARHSLVAGFTPKPYPTKMDTWRIVVQIAEPPEFTEGGLVLPEEYRDRAEFASYIGYVIDMGPLCHKAVTRSGLNLDTSLKFEIGDWVQFGKHDGEKFRTVDGTLYIVMADTCVIGVVKQPELFECMSF